MAAVASEVYSLSLLSTSKVMVLPVRVLTLRWEDVDKIKVSQHGSDEMVESSVLGSLASPPVKVDRTAKSQSRLRPADRISFATTHKICIVERDWL